MRRNPRLDLGLVVPVLLGLVFVLDVGTRLLPADNIAFRGWEVVRRYAPPDAPFEPNRRFESKASYGDLAALGNLPDQRVYRAERFTIDSYGYRNPPERMAETPIAILAGSSFSVGDGLTDDQTLSAQLSQASGGLVYNSAGEFWELSLHRVQEIARRSGMRRGTVILEYIERFDFPPPGTEVQKPCAVVPRTFDPVCTDILGFMAVSPAEILAEQLLKSVQNGRVLPNPAASRVMQRRLANGDSVLFLPDEVARFNLLQQGSAEAERIAIDYLSWLRDQLAADQLDLVVVLVPNKYTVYYPLLDPPLAPEQNVYLDRLAAGLAKQQFVVVNLLTPLRDAARTALARGEYVYWPDDTHWNAEGVAVAVRQILGKWKLEARSLSCRLASNC